MGASNVGDHCFATARASNHSSPSRTAPITCSARCRPGKWPDMRQPTMPLFGMHRRSRRARRQCCSILAPPQMLAANGRASRRRRRKAICICLYRLESGRRLKGRPPATLQHEDPVVTGVSLKQLVPSCSPDLCQSTGLLPL